MSIVTKKLTTAAVCTALAVVLCAMTAYLPLSFMPLFLAAFCIFVSCRRAGAAYGVLCAAASIALMFLMTGLSVKWLAFIMVFAPYGVLASFINGLTYRKVKTAVIRACLAVVYFNLTVGLLYLITVKVATVGLDGLDITAWASKVGGYAVLAVIITAVMLPLDVMFSELSAVVLKKIPPIKSKKDLISESKKDGEEPAEPEYDIFGYEIKRHDDKTGDGKNGE